MRPDIRTRARGGNSMRTQSDDEHHWGSIFVRAPRHRLVAAYQRSWLRPDMVAGLTLAAYSVPVQWHMLRLPACPSSWSLLLPGGRSRLRSFRTSRQLAIGPTSAISILIGSAWNVGGWRCAAPDPPGGGSSGAGRVIASLPDSPIGKHRHFALRPCLAGSRLVQAWLSLRPTAEVVWHKEWGKQFLYSDY